MKRHPFVNTRLGRGRLFKIEGDMAHVEFDFLYLVEIPLHKLDLKGVDLSNVEIVGNPEIKQGRGWGREKR